MVDINKPFMMTATVFLSEYHNETVFAPFLEGPPEAPERSQYFEPVTTLPLGSSAAEIGIRVKAALRSEFQKEFISQHVQEAFEGVPDRAELLKIPKPHQPKDVRFKHSGSHPVYWASQSRNATEYTENYWLIDVFVDRFWENFGMESRIPGGIQLVHLIKFANADHETVGKTLLELWQLSKQKSGRNSNMAGGGWAIYIT